jgi:predicted MPP superfamily phosphohydrolase
MFFNPILLLIDVGVLRLINRTRKIWVCWALGAAVVFAGIILGAIESLQSSSYFHFVRLTAYGVFLHAPLLLIGTGAIFWKERRRLAVGTAGIGVILLAVAGYSFLIEPFWLEVKHYEIASPKIKKPLRIVVIADLQTEIFGEYEKRVLNKTMELKPDLILMAGDYLQSSALGQVQAINSYLRKIGFSAPLGTLIVQGNIDGDDFMNLFAGLDVTAVRFRQEFDLDALNVTCLSLSESHSAQTQVDNPDPKKFHIVMGHEPNFALGGIDADLLVAGHTHGGQVRFPLIGPLTVLSKVPKSWGAGMTDLSDGRKLLVPRGIGMERGDAPPLRFLCRPELAVVDLKPAQ